MSLTSTSTLQGADDDGGARTSVFSPGGGVTQVGWDSVNDKPTNLFAQNGGSDGYSETIAPTYDTSGPSAKGPLFTGAGEDIEWRRDPANDIALEVRDTTNDTRLLWLDDNGRLHTRMDQEAFADGAGSAAPGTNSLLQVEDEGTVLSSDAASMNFTGSAVSATANGDDVMVTITGGGSPTDILEGGSEVVADATDIDFNASQFNVTDEGSSEAGVALEGEFIDDRVAALLAAGSGISLSYDDPGDSLTITNTGTSSTAGEFSGVEATRDTTLSVGSGSATIIDWDGALFDTDSYHSTSSNTSRLTVPTAGKYLIGGTIEFAAWAVLSDGRLQVRLFKNGAFIRELIDNEVDSSGGDGPSYSFQTVVDAAQGDYFELSVLQASGGSRDLTTNSVFYASRLQGSGPSALPDLNDVDSATQTDGYVFASGGGNYRGESLSSMWSDHVSPIGSSDIAADAVGPTEIDSTTGTAYDIDISGDADTLDGVEGGNYARRDGTGEVTTFGDGTFNDQFISIRNDIANGGMSVGLDTSLNGGAGGLLLESGENKIIALRADRTSGTFGGTTPHVVVDTTGNAGFGSETAPSYAVDVAGTAAADTVRIGGYAVTEDANSNLTFTESGGSKVLELTSGGILRAAGDVVAFGLSGGSGAGSSSGLQTSDPLSLDTTTDPDTLSFVQGIENSSGTTVVTGATDIQFKGTAVSDVANPSGSRVEVTIDGNTYTDSDAISAINNDSDHGSTASHNYYTDSDAVSAINNDADHGATASHNYFSGSHSDLSNVGPNDHHTKTTSASDLTDVSADSVSDAHHSRYSNSEAVSALQSHDGTNINADTLDGVEGGNYARTDQNEVFSPPKEVRFGDYGGEYTIITSSGATAHSGGALLGNSENVTSGDEWLKVSTSFTSGGGGEAYIGWVDESDRETYVNGGPSASISGNGNWGFGGIADASYAVEVDGDVRSTGEQEAFLGSDRRLKDNVTPIGGALDKIAQIGGYGFEWHDEDAVQPHKRGEQDVGVIAQEVAEVCPEAVTEFGGGHSEGYQAVNYDRLVPLLIEAVKDLRSQVQELR